MSNVRFLFPGGTPKALTLSYDDGVGQDRRLVEILNGSGLKATFNLNSYIMEKGGSWVNKGVVISRLASEEVHDLYEGHEVAVHSLTHPFLESLPREEVIREILEDRVKLEKLVDYPVRGMAYPYGTYSKFVMEVLETLGIEYSRTVAQHEGFRLPDSWLEWHPTCHHVNPKLMEIADRFLEMKTETLSVFYVWGHSYEFDVDDNWALIEKFASKMGGKSDIWYATNIQIVDYVKALRNLKLSAAGTWAYNPSAVSVWLRAGEKTIEIGPGENKALA